MKMILWGIMLLTVTTQAKNIYTTFTVEATHHANLAFTGNGTVNNVYVDVGSKVKQNQVLAVLQHDDLSAVLNIAKTALKYAKKDNDRQLRVENIVNQASLDKYAFAYDNAKNQLIYKQALLDKTVLKAPFDGIIYNKSVEVGDVVSGVAVRTVLRIQSLHDRKLVLEIDQKYWKVLKAGLKFKYKVDGDNKEYEGQISNIYPFANNNNRKIRAEVKAQDFVPGLFGEGYIIIPDED